MSIRIASGRIASARTARRLPLAVCGGQPATRAVAHPYPVVRLVFELVAMAPLPSRRSSGRDATDRRLSVGYYPRVAAVRWVLVSERRLVGYPERPVQLEGAKGSSFRPAGEALLLPLR
jgi:hypothetical protein